MALLLKFLLPSSECRKAIPKSPAEGQTEPVQGWCHPWEVALHHRVILVTAHQGCPPDVYSTPAWIFWWEEGKERLQHLLPRALPTVLKSEQWEWQSFAKGTIP